MILYLCSKEKPQAIASDSGGLSNIAYTSVTGPSCKLINSPINEGSDYHVLIEKCKEAFKHVTISPSDFKVAEELGEGIIHSFYTLSFSSSLL